MEQLSLQLPEAAPLPLLPLMISLGLGLILAVSLRWHFQRFGSTLSNRGEFAQVFPFIVLTTVLIITVVKSSLALSLGLVGALSIVRFRTPIKEPEELAYLFMAIAMGLGLGADQWYATVLASVVILAAIAALRWAQRDREDKSLFLSIDWSGYDGSDQRLDALNEVVSRHVSIGDIRRIDARDGGLEATYFVDVSESGKISALLDDLKRTFPGIGVSFIDQNRLPSV